MATVPKALQKSYPTRTDIDEETLDKNTSLAWMLQMVGRRKDVLDVGCASGYLAKLFSAHDCNVVGIERNTQAAETAASYCSRVIVADLDFASLADTVEGATFDVIVFGDVLEHIREPGRLLSEARSLIRAQGFVVASIPNIAHGAIRLALLSGSFDYQEVGILDETHLRFYTLKTIEELFAETGFEIRRIERTKLPLFEPSDLTPPVERSDFSAELIAQVESDPEVDTLQFVVQAFPLGDEERTRALTKRFVAANTKAATAERQIERQNQKIAELDAQLEETRRNLATAHEEMMRAQSSYEIAVTRPNVRASLDEAVPAQVVAQRSDIALAIATNEIERLRQQIDTATQTIADLTAVAKTAHATEIELVRVQERLAFETTRLSTAERRTLELEQQTHTDRETLLRQERSLERSASERTYERRRFEEEIASLQTAIAAADRQAATLQEALELSRAEEGRLTKQSWSLRDLLDSRDAQLQQLSEEIRAKHELLERAVADRDRFEQQALSLTAHVSGVETEREQTRSELKRQSDEFEQGATALQQRILEFERRYEQAATECLDLRDQIAVARQHNEALETRLAHQTEVLIDRTRRERQEVSDLIDIVQSSTFWKLKRFLNRLMGRPS